MRASTYLSQYLRYISKDISCFREYEFNFNFSHIIVKSFFIYLGAIFFIYLYIFSSYQDVPNTFFCPLAKKVICFYCFIILVFIFSSPFLSVIYLKKKERDRVQRLWLLRSSFWNRRAVDVRKWNNDESKTNMSKAETHNHAHLLKRTRICKRRRTHTCTRPYTCTHTNTGRSRLINN